MPLVQAWQCPKTNKLFVCKDLYQQHLKILARESLDRKRIKRIDDEYHAVFKQMREDIRSIAELEQYIITNWELFCRNAHRKNKYSESFNYDNWVKIEVIYIDVKWNDRISNTHSWPLNGGVMARRSVTQDCPSSYPGWSGKMRVGYSSTKKGKDTGLIDDFFYQTGLFGGTGGGSDTGFSQQLRLFAADWTGLYQEEVMNRLEH
jgi:hypothetical protein